MTSRVFRYSVIWLLSSLFLLACSDPQPYPARLPVEHELPAVQLAMETLVEHYQTVGSIISDERVEISSRFPAYVRAIKVREGEQIRAGQVLVQLDARDQKAAVRRAQAQQEISKEALSDAERTLADVQTLFARGLISDAARRKAQLERDAAEQTLRAQVASVRAAEAQLRYTEIVSPVDGVVTARSARAGDLVTPGRPLLVVESDTALLFETAVAESQVQHINTGDEAQVRIDATARSYKASVLRVIPSGDPVTRRFTVKLQLHDAEGLTPGLFGRSRFRIGETKGLRVPETALAERGGLTGVFVVSDTGRLNFRWVRTGRQEQGNIEVTAGLRPDEIVLAQVTNAVRDGDTLKLQPKP